MFLFHLCIACFVTLLVSQTIQRRMARSSEKLIGKDSEGSCRDLIWIRFQHLREVTERNHENLSIVGVTAEI